MTTSDQSSKLWWIVPAIGFLALVALAVVFGRAPDLRGHGTSYDASSRGFRAAYLILEELHYPVSRSRRPSEGSVRFVLVPKPSAKAAEALKDWVSRGGVVVLADEDGEFARHMGISLAVRQIDIATLEEPASGPGIARLAGGKTFVTWSDRPGRVWARAGNQPFVTVHRLGRGEVWLLNRPQCFRNQLIGHGDNALVLCRLADEVLRERPGQLAFDEYVHGMRESPGVTELLLTPPTLWVTLEGLLLLGLLLWHFVPRFGTLRPVPPARRRSKEEFLDAMASLLERKGDYADAYRSARNDLSRTLERDLGLPAGTPPAVLAREAGRRRRVPDQALRHVLTAEAVPAGAGAAAFLTALNELEIIRHELFDGRRPR
jgi:hypothetical protein